jgi:hypothetical protein
LLREHGAAIEADLLRYFRIDLVADLGTDRLTWRRLAVLIAALPRDSAYVLSVYGERARWGEMEHLLADLSDQMAGVSYLLAAAHFKGKPKPPQPRPRPGVDTPGKRKFGTARLSVEQLRKALGMDKRKR